MAKTNFNDVEFDNIEADNITAADVTANNVVADKVKAAFIGTAKISKADSYALTAAEAKALFVPFEMSAESKALVLGLTDGQIMLVKNVGATNAVTVKGLSGDTGTSVAAGKIALVIGSTTASGTSVDILN